MEEANQNGKLFDVSLSDVLHNSMMPYAEHVIMDRALPRVEDGLKPVQRRILYTMYEMGLTPDKPHRKCAKIVGDCLGKYHPHGDSSVYDALVRMAQPFNMRMTLVGGHGNFGTVDGDSAAAYRYTEARLEAISYELLRDIDKDTVNFSLNFDDTTTEPDTLPSRYPNLLVNGAYGIAVGLATNIPTHNLSEVIDAAVAVIDNPKIKLDALMRHIKGPDFPTGGYIMAGDELRQAYETGRGKIKIRARVSVERDGEKQMLVITEIPYQVNKSALLKSIADLKEEKDKKDEILAGISDIVDESDRNGMRAVIKLKKDADAKKILAHLYKRTQLEMTFGINMVAIADGKPRQMGLIEILTYYVNYQRDVILRRSKFDLARAKERAHILEGLIIAVQNIDEVVKIIRQSKDTADAKQNLSARFSLSDAQSQAILDLRLARLTKLEIVKLEEELAELKKRIDELTAIIGDKALQMEVVKKEMTEIKKKYPSPRHSLIVTQDGEELPADEEPEVVEDLAVWISANGMLKKMTKKAFDKADRQVGERTTKNEIVESVAFVKSNERLYAVTDAGNACALDFSLLSENHFRDKGTKLTEAVREAGRNEKVVGFFTLGKEGDELALITEQGVVKRILNADAALDKAYYPVIRLADGDKLLAVRAFNADGELFFVTEGGKALAAKTDDIPLQKIGAGGVRGMTLNKGDRVIFADFTLDGGEIITVTSEACYKRVIAAEVDPIARGGKGVKICELGDSATLIYAGYVREPFTLVMTDAMGLSFSVDTEDISIEGRTTKGKTLKNEHKKRIPVCCHEIRS